MFVLASGTFGDDSEYLRVCWEPIQGEKERGLLLQLLQFRARVSTPLLETLRYVVGCLIFQSGELESPSHPVLTWFPLKGEPLLVGSFVPDLRDAAPLGLAFQFWSLASYLSRFSQGSVRWRLSAPPPFMFGSMIDVYSLSSFPVSLPTLPRGSRDPPHAEVRH